jgi:radical SAM superfamily enzyme YgiQ (UPF0313 family)/glycosyltransferase involved in cell wall biosynthesis
MTYLVAMLATRWGSELGGVNVFNTGLASAMPSVLTKHSRTICFVDELPKYDVQLPAGIDLLLTPESAGEVAELLGLVCDELREKSLSGVLVVGHDAITGQLAIDSVKLLKDHRPTVPRISSAVVSHMDYWEYAGKKGTPHAEVVARREVQKKVVAGADYAFAVGPLLTANFSSARGLKLGRGSPGRRLIPGASEISIQPYDRRESLQFFISGRLNKDDDPIKNTGLVVHSLKRAYQQRRVVKDDRWRARGRLIAYGADPKDAGMLKGLQLLANEDACFQIDAVEFSSDQAAMHRCLADCHIALMPSWHEGFGLSGWEALCAGVPLLCSRQSGLARLLEEFKASRPELSLESVEFVNLSGPNDDGEPSEHDINLVSKALGEMVTSLQRRKDAAKKLAKALKAEFTWKGCASDMLDGIEGWYLPGSVHWSARQRFAADASTKSESEAGEEALDRVMLRLDSLKLVDDWQDLTTAFNYLSDLGKVALRIKKNEHQRQLGEIGFKVNALVDVPGDLAGLRDSGLMDVCWRYMAACSAITDDITDFVNLLPDRLLQAIWSDSFLTREMLHYVKRFETAFGSADQDWSAWFFGPLPGGHVRHPTVAQRAARLASSHPSFLKILGGIDKSEAYALEAKQCVVVLESPHDVGREVDSNPALVGTILAQMALVENPSRQVADQARAFIKFYFPAAREEGYWRGDKRLNAALATATLSTVDVLPALRVMANDEDESIRWAALHLCFSQILRGRLEASVRAGKLVLDVPLNEALGQVVDNAVKFDLGHPWLCREFLLHFQKEWQHASEPASGEPSVRFTLLDFPIARGLFGPVIGEARPALRGALHPEVRYVREAALQSIRRILLVLPPIEWGKGQTAAASSTSTPPLGLGILATHLTSQGHDVQIADCHRFPALTDEVIRLASTFDMIGCNAVFTTVKSIVHMLGEIKSRSARAIVVVGGPVPKLRAWKQVAAAAGDMTQSWDFAISDNAEDNLMLLVESLNSDEPWPETAGMHANSESAALKRRDVAERLRPSQEAQAWREITVDRRVFRAEGKQYEPSRTRSREQEVFQAHVVMSQGCDWNCVFCTERSSESGGERRRTVRDVLAEVGQLASAYDYLNIQFIDDNVFPQIATLSSVDESKLAAALSWTMNFLEGLERVRSQSKGTFGWRGIFRIEDFLSYESALGQGKFQNLLSRSGCRLLAFGVEHGDEEQRRRIKAAKEKITNAQVVDLFARLRRSDILTKAFFILGGQWESEASAMQTIDFAIESGATLAYFALYKDFTKAAVTFRRARARSEASGKEFLDYRQLAMRWDAGFGERDLVASDVNGAPALAHAPTDEERACYAELAVLGFSFFDVVKYNDFHNDKGPSLEVLRTMTWMSPEAYFSLVERAYRRFYLRPQFVSDYKLLLSHGY